jgi:hypothetical protein
MFLRHLFTFLAIFALAACQTSAPARLGSPQFSGPSFMVRAGDIGFTRSSPVPATDVQARYQFPTRLDSGMEKWANDRIKLVGGQNRLELEIVEATITEEVLPTTKGLAGLFKNEQSSRYRGKLKVLLKLYTPDRISAHAGVESEVQRSITVPEGLSVAERQQAFNDLVISMLQQVDTDMSQRIPQHMAEFLETY